MIEPYKAKSKTGVKKAIGQLNKVLQMIEDDAYCMDLLQQIRAVEGLLNSLSANILESHLHTCGARAFSTKDKKQHKKIIDELIVAFKAAKK
jgi:CsoR family transcriptional regulator, copper-sensing transcriptional repressor